MTFLLVGTLKIVRNAHAKARNRIQTWVEEDWQAGKSFHGSINGCSINDCRRSCGTVVFKVLCCTIPLRPSDILGPYVFRVDWTVSTSPSSKTRNAHDKTLLCRTTHLSLRTFWTLCIPGGLISFDFAFFQNKKHTMKHLSVVPLRPWDIFGPNVFRVDWIIVSTSPSSSKTRNAHYVWKAALSYHFGHRTFSDLMYSPGRLNSFDFAFFHNKKHTMKRFSILPCHCTATCSIVCRYPFASVSRENREECTRQRNL
jgi:hypothetical protein